MSVKDVRKRVFRDRKSFTFIDLFSGIGGFHYALKSLGGECVMSCEIDKDCRRIYSENFGIQPEEDITKLEIEKIPDFNLLCGGFPCQSYSHAGKQKGFLDKVRGTLYFNVLEILTKRQPDYFILENVKNLKGHDKGKTWKTIYDSLIDAGYNTYSEPIIASPTHFGIPQNRERVFIIGKRRDLGELPEFPVYKKKKTDLYDILEDDEEIEEKELEKIQIDEDLESVLNHWEEFLQHFKEKKIKLPTFPIWTTYFVEEFDTDDLPAWKSKFIEQNISFYLEHQEFLNDWLERSKEIEGFKGSLAKFEWQCGKFQDDDSIWNLLFQLRPSGIRVKRRDYSPALVAMNQVVYIGKKKRKLSRREVARLQSFPEDCELEKNQNKCYKQFGNAVNVKVVEEIGKFLLGKK